MKLKSKTWVSVAYITEIFFITSLLACKLEQNGVTKRINGRKQHLEKVTATKGIECEKEIKTY